MLTASFDRRVTDRNATEQRPKTKLENDQPSLDLFFLTRVPPNFPRKDSSFFILCAFADVVPDIFGHVMRLRAVSVSFITSSCDAFRTRRTVTEKLARIFLRNKRRH